MGVTLAACGEPFATFCTFKRCLSGMDTKMCVTVAAYAETFTTYCAFIGFFSSMDT